MLVLTNIPLALGPEDALGCRAANSRGEFRGVRGVDRKWRKGQPAHWMRDWLWWVTLSASSSSGPGLIDAPAFCTSCIVMPASSNDRLVMVLRCH